MAACKVAAGEGISNLVTQISIYKQQCSPAWHPTLSLQAESAAAAGAETMKGAMILSPRSGK